MRVCISGAGGFIGGHLVRVSQEQGHQVVALVRHAPRKRSQGIEYAVSDLSGSINPRLLNGTDVLVHCAGLAHRFKRQRSQDYFSGNVETTRNIALAALEAGVSHLVLVSSVSVYGYGTNGTNPVGETDPCSPRDAYACSKLQAEILASKLAAGTTTKLTILRLGTVYGRGDPGNMARLIRMIRSGFYFPLGREENRKSFLNVEDVVAALIRVIEVDTADAVGIYNVAGKGVTLREITSEIYHALGKKKPMIYIPKSLAQTVASCAKNLPPLAPFGISLNKMLSDDVFDSRLFESKFSWQPSIDLASGLRDEVGWLLKAGM